MLHKINLSSGKTNQLGVTIAAYESSGIFTVSPLNISDVGSDALRGKVVMLGITLGLTSVDDTTEGTNNAVDTAAGEPAGPA